MSASKTVVCETVVSELLAKVRHTCDRLGVDYVAAERRSYGVYRCAQGGPVPAPRARASEGSPEAEGERCDACAGLAHPGVLWPCASNGDDSKSWVERCDNCARYETDEDAAVVVARSEGRYLGFDHAGGKTTPSPYIVDGPLS